ncbi:Trm112 family protein [Streptomyces sp. NPDC000594]|uniref:Trm112 family protein n=1 Tax=Streptomyces sp. NPDC000594 TaxID=3154261 RepID=UPI0033344AE9
MNADDPLLGILVCPLDKGPLRLVRSGADPAGDTAPADEASGGDPGGSGDALYNPRLRRLYPIVDGVPHLRPSSGTPVPAGEHERLTAQLSRPPA